MSNYIGRYKHYRIICVRKTAIALCFFMIAIFWAMYFIQFREIIHDIKGIMILPMIIPFLFSLFYFGYAVIAILMRIFGKRINAVIVDDTARMSRTGNIIHDLLLQCEDESGCFYTVYRYSMKKSIFNINEECPYNVGEGIVIMQLWCFIAMKED